MKPGRGNLHHATYHQILLLLIGICFTLPCQIQAQSDRYPVKQSLIILPYRSAMFIDQWMQLGPFNNNDEPGSRTLQQFLQPPDALPLWRQGEPFLWQFCKTDSPGRMLPRRYFSPARVGKRVYLSSTISSEIQRKVFLEIETSGQIQVWVNNQSVEPVINGQHFSFPITLQTGNNNITLQSNAPSTQREWFVQARLQDNPTQILAATDRDYTANTQRLEADGNILLQFALFTPATDPTRDVSVPRPLIILPAVEPGETFNAAAFDPGLIQTASEHQWLLARLLTRPPPHQRKSWLISLLKTLQTKDIRYDQQRVYFLTSGRHTTAALETAILARGSIAAIAIIDPLWNVPGDWRNLIRYNQPLPAILILGEESAGDPLIRLSAELRKRGDVLKYNPVPTVDSDDRKWRDVFDFFSQHPSAISPRSVAISMSAPGQGRAGWIHTKSAINWNKPAMLRVVLNEPGLFDVQTVNLSRFDLLLKNAPGLNNMQALTLRMTEQKVRIFGAKFPEAISLTYIEEKGNNHWQAGEITAETFYKSEAPRQILGQAESEWEAQGHYAQGGTAQLIARAVREACGADIALIPTYAVQTGHYDPAVTLADVVAWSMDATLTTASIPAQTLLAALERDWAGPRNFISDGLDAIAVAPPATIEEESDYLTEKEWQSNQSTLSKNNPSEKQARILNESRLHSRQGNVIVASWRGLLENSESWLGLKIHRGSLDPELPASVGLQLHDTGRKQREVLVEYLDRQTRISPPEPDIQPLPRKRASQGKIHQPKR